MKSPRYTAGVVSIYRKYVDRYLAYGRSGYKVDEKDRKMLLELFDRGGFTEGYYRQHNGRDMVALREKPAFREANQALFDRLDTEYVNKKKQEPVRGHVTVQEGEPVAMELETADGICVSVTGAEAQTAQNQPLTEDKLLKQMNKTGNAPFYFDKLTAKIDGNCFIPVQALNELRRRGIEELERVVLAPYRRQAKPIAANQENAGRGKETENSTLWGEKGAGDCSKLRIHVSLEEPDGLSTVLVHPDVDEIYLDATGFGAETWKETVRQCRQAGKQCALLLPHIFRKEAEQYLMTHAEELREAGFDELVLRSMEELEFLREIGVTKIPLVLDSNLYTMNHMAAEQMTALGASRLTLPLELNSRELEELERGSQNMDGWEMVAYGYLPAMVSAQCIVRTTKGCTHRPELLMMKDRTGKALPVKNHCRFCYNTIYNPSPLSLLGQERMIKRLKPDVLRLCFTVEPPRQIRAVLDAYADSFRYGKDVKAPFEDFTRGHLKRGVE